MVRRLLLSSVIYALVGTTDCSEIIVKEGRNRVG